MPRAGSFFSTTRYPGCRSTTRSTSGSSCPGVRANRRQSARTASYCGFVRWTPLKALPVAALAHERDRRCLRGLLVLRPLAHPLVHRPERRLVLGNPCHTTLHGSTTTQGRPRSNVLGLGVGD